jgi:hypothetical protein
MNRYLAKLQQIERGAKQCGGFVGFVSPPTWLDLEKGEEKEAATTIAKGFGSFVSAQSSPNSEFQNPKNATDVNRQNCQNPYGRVFEELRSGCPALVEADRWHQAVRDAETFLAKWGDHAHALGWTARELFGLHSVPERPTPTFRRLARYDSTGLIWLLQGRPLIALTATEAAIQSAGAVVVYRKHRKPAYGPLGDCLDDMEPRS